jgi:hypothetical protein
VRTPRRDIDLEPSATAADWLEVGPDDRRPFRFDPRAYAAEISVPSFGDRGVEWLLWRMLEPEPLPELELEAKAGPELEAGI